MAVTSLAEVFLTDLKELLFSGLEFINFSVNHKAHIGNNVVHVPQMAESISVVVNPTGSTSSHYRTDTDLTYNIDHYASTPVQIDVKDETHTNYSLRESSIRAHANQLNQDIGDLTSYIWAGNVATASSVLTTGATSSTNLAPSATGYRKKLTQVDFRNAAKFLDKQKISKNGRYALVPTDMYYELFDDAELKSIDFMNGKGLPEGVITKLYGINIMDRPSGLICDDLNNPLTPTATGNATDNQAVLVWQESNVASAYDKAEIYLSESDPNKYGASTLGAGVFFGASPMRTDGAGVIMIVQDES